MEIFAPLLAFVLLASFTFFRVSQRLGSKKKAMGGLDQDSANEHSNRIKTAQYSSAKQKAYLKNLYPRYPKSKLQLFGILPKLNENIKEEALDFLEFKSEKADLDLWLQHFPHYQDLYVKHFLRYLRMHFAVADQETLAPYAGNPEVREWFEEKGLRVPQATLAGSLNMEEEEVRGEISEAGE
jgi:hypothetical protein